ncbi:cation:proton antiporter [Vibrio maritimus]
MENTSLVYFVLSVLLVVAAGVGVASIIGVGSIVGFIFAGIALGPNTPGLVASSDVELLHSIADLGVVLFIFTVGLEMKPKELWQMKRSLVLQGIGQVVIVAGIFATFSYYLVGTWALGLAIGAIVAQSSSAMVLSILQKNGESDSPSGRNTFINLMGQDLSIVPIVALIPLLVGHVAKTSSHFGEELLSSFAAILLIVFVGHYFLPAALGFTFKRKNKEGFTLILLISIVGTVYLASLAGISSTLAAFLLGMSLSTSDFRFVVEEVIKPFKASLMALFFASVGMSVDLGILQNEFGTVLSLLLSVIVIKSIVFYILACVDRQPRTTAIRTAFSLNHVGEFAFVLISLAVGVGLLTVDQGAIGLVVVCLSMIVIPWLNQLGGWIASKHTTDKGEKFETNREQSKLVVVGLDEVGRLISELAKRAGIPYVAFDLDIKKVKAAKSLGLNAQLGDILTDTVQKKLNINEVNAAFITALNSKRLKKIALRLNRNPRLTVYARTNSRADEIFLKTHGIAHAGSIYIESTLLRGAELLHDFGVPETKVTKLLDGVRNEFYRHDYAGYVANTAEE